MNKRFIIFFVSVILVFVFLSSFLLLKRDFLNLVINGFKFDVSIAEKESEWQRGLSFRKSIKENEAMLFVFPYEDRWSIWMKDMNFPIDVLWLDSNKKIIYLIDNMTPESYPNFFVPKEKSKYVVEMSSNMIEKLAIKKGDQVFFGR